MILYAVVSNGRSVLAEHSERELPDSIPASTRALLAKIGADSARRMSYQLGAEHHVHYVLDDGVTFLCMTGAGAKWRVAFAYLEEVRTRFNYSYPMHPGGGGGGGGGGGDGSGDGGGGAAHLFQRQAEFGPVLRDQMRLYNENGAGDAIDRLHEGLDEVKEVVLRQVDRVLERGERLDLLVDKSAELNDAAFTFQRQSRKLKHAMCWRKVQQWCAVLVLVLVVVYAVVGTTCGFKLECTRPAVPGNSTAPT